MLLHLSIDNFTIVDHIDLELEKGLSVITGETGAGKSIAMEAIHFALGAKVDTGILREPQKECVISLTFNLEQGSEAQALLMEWGIEPEDEYILTRTLSAQGRSACRLNGNLFSVGQIKTLSPHLIDLHGQHAHQRLLKGDTQRNYIDSYGEHINELEQYKADYKHYQKHLKLIADIKARTKQQEQQQSLLGYQLAELNELKPQLGEYEELDARHKILSQAEFLLTQHQHCQQLMVDQEDRALLDQIAQLIKLVDDLQDAQPDAISIIERLMIVIEECRDLQRELLRMGERIELDPQSLQEVTERLALYQRIAKKHNVHVHELAEHHQQIIAACDGFENDNDHIITLEAELPTLLDNLNKSASNLSEKRKKSAEGLTLEVKNMLPTLNLPYAKFKVECTPLAALSEHGAELISFLFCANQGQEPAPLGKVISGGELSRLSLSLQVAVAGNMGANTLIFDEVDVGISGATASAVGQLLKRLGQKTQIISISHLPQVAACADQHLLVEKQHEHGSTQSSIKCLSTEQRIEELARLLGAQKITQAAKDNAIELLTLGQAA